MAPETTTPTDGAECGGTYRLHGDTAIAFGPERTAVLVIDPVNDFLSEGGAGWEMTKTTVKKNDVVAKLKRLIDGARAKGVPVLFAPMAYTAEDYANQELQRRSGINRIMFEKKMFQAGSWGADFHPDLQPAADEIVLLPHKGIDVFGTDLPQHLDRLGTTHLVIAGMTANLCCESTGRHAMEHGYDVTFISDAIGAENLAAYEAALRVNYPLIANAVLTVDELLDAVASAPASAAEAVQQGDTVLGSDRGKIGTVQDVVPASDGGPAHMLVARGVIFDKDTFVPLDAVVKRSGDQVFINVPKLVAKDMPWGDKPSSATRQDKLGKPSGEAGALYRSRQPSAAER